MVLSKHWNLVREKYKLIEMIGAGCSGEVVLAKIRSTKEPVAIKMITVKADESHIHFKYILREI